MPCDKKTAKTLISKLAGLPGFPREYPSAVTAMIETLTERARNDDHAAHVIGTLLESAERCPVVADIIRLCQESGKKFARQVDPGCPQCIEGWRQCWFLTTMNAGAHWKHERISKQRAYDLEPRLQRQQVITTAVEKCQCQGGRVVVPEQELLAFAEEF